MPITTGSIRIVDCPPAALARTACSHIAEVHGTAAPDLTGLTVLLPHAHARPAFARALSRAFDRPVLLLPQLTSLREWAAAAVPMPGMLAPAAREALLYRVLAERRWIAQADRWAIAAELGVLFDELTRWQIGLPRLLEDFARELERAYRARAGVSFMFEARLVHELWHALVKNAERPDPETAYHLQLAALARTVEVPIYAVGLTGLAPAEQAFLERCAERVAVTWFRAALNDDAGDPLLAALSGAWPEHITASMHARAAALRRRSAASPLAGRLRCFGAAGAEEEAQAVAVSVRRWLLQGRRDIAVVVLDRVSARRARALLERAEILVRDEAGWAFSTTSAATVIGRWFDAIGDDFYHRDLLDVLKSPFAFHDWPRLARQRAVWRLERALREANLRSGLARYRELMAQRPDTALERMLARVERGVRALGHGRRKTLAAWIAALLASLDEIGVRAGLAADLAGAQLLELLAALSAELANDTLVVGWGDFRRWLARTLESTTFRDRGIDSPVVFTSLEATRLRSFDAVLLLGADAAHLPGTDAASLFFNQAVRRELGLPVRAQQIRELETLLIELISTSPEVLVTWQRNRDGEENLLSPLFERLRAFHHLAWGGRMDDMDLRALIAAATLPPPVPEAMPEPTRAPAPSAPPGRVPAVISPSGYNALMSCPYRFHARYVLGLKALDEVQEEVDKSDYGNCIHAVLDQFHRQLAQVAMLAPAEAEQLLDELSVAAFREVIATDYLASAWLARWRALIPCYVAWQQAREREGWRFVAAEAERELMIETPAGRKLTLKGRIDRVDANPEGAVAVIDYKTQARTTLNARLKLPGEDVQLPAYALLWGGEVAAALFLSLEREVEPAVLKGDIGEQAAAVGARLGQLYDAVVEGAPLPAQGAPGVCMYCEMHGVCRRKHWP